MVFLDANAFYWYLGREKLFSEPSVPKHDVKKLNLYLDARDDKSIPASAFMEMLVHFRDNPEAIMRIIRFREMKNISVLNNLYDYRFTTEELTVLHMMRDYSGLKQYAYKLLETKIEIEVKHTYLFLQIVSLLYADYHLKTHKSLDDEAKGKILSYLGRDVFEGLRDELYSALVSALRVGYMDNNRSQQALKKKYIELLIQNCLTFQMIIDAAVNVLENEENVYALMCKLAAEAKSNGFTDDRIMNKIKEVLSTDSAFLQEAENKIASIFEKKGYSKHQAYYLKLMLKAWLERGQKLVKNDIFDMLCVGALDSTRTQPVYSIMVDQSSYLISFDETMMKFLCRSMGNVRLLNQFLMSEFKLPM